MYTSMKHHSFYFELHNLMYFANSIKSHHVRKNVKYLLEQKTGHVSQTHTQACMHLDLPSVLKMILIVHVTRYDSRQGA